MRVLVLGGTSEATLLIDRLQARSDSAVILSLAGRTANPALPAVAYRIGGFGGVAGLIAYLANEAIDVVIDATHPFAEQISANAETACVATGTPLVVFTRPGWSAVAGDQWTEVARARDAAETIGHTPKRVFLTTWRLQLAAFERAPQHEYVIRSIDPPDPAPSLPRYRVLLSRGPFDAGAEERLMREHRIEVVVTKNSGGNATYGKIEAARRLGIPVILIRRPAASAVSILHDADAVLAFVDAHRPAP